MSKELLRPEIFTAIQVGRTLEQRLSEMENAFARLVRRLRLGEGLEEKHLLCQFVASTQVRTANLRTGVSEAMEMFTAEFGNALITPESQAEIAKHALNGVLEKIAAGASALRSRIICLRS